jgi:ubiquinol-cytochrome c reductase iron-sulfur subunit
MRERTGRVESGGDDPLQSPVDPQQREILEDPMSNSTVDASKRTWLIASSCAGAVGAGFVAVPFVSSFEPSERAKAAGAPVEVDISALQPGQKMTVEWRGKPVWILRRTPEMLASLKKTDDEVADPNSKRTAFETPDYAKNEWRSRKPEYFVAVGICTHLGCSPGDKFQPGPQPSLPDDWQGGFLCPCHGSTFDLAGRVYKNKPAPDNLEVPPYVFLTDTRLLIGEDKKA